MHIQPQLYLTADTHFGHQNIVQWHQRTITHNEDMVKVWNKTVSPKAIVLHLGDLSLCNKESTQQYTLKLNGQKYLVLGNHDHHSDSWYRDVGFTVIPACYRQFQDKYGHTYAVLFTHEPVIPLPPGWFNVHGHLHGNDHRNIVTSPAHYDVGVDAHEFQPIPLSQILDHFKTLL